jgi:hypothetical protein
MPMEETKKCRACQIEKPINGFQISKNCKNGRSRTCMVCFRERYKERNAIKSKEKYLMNPEKYKERSKQYRKNNPEKMREIYRAKNKNPVFRAKRNLRRRLKELLFDKGISHDSSVGCSKKEFTTHLESKFQLGMSWDNYGKGDKFWVIDHIKPLALFDLTDRTQRHAANHYSNLQPLWSLHNESKSDNYDSDHPMGWKGLDELIEG